MTERLARYAARRPWRVIAMWGGVVVLAIAAMGLLFDDLDPEGALTSNPESVRAHDLKELHLSDEDDTSEIVVLRSDSLTVGDQDFQGKIDSLLTSLDQVEVVEFAGDPRDVPGLVSGDERAVMIPVRLTEEGEDDVEPLIEAVEADDEAPFVAGVTGDHMANHDFTEMAGRDLQEGELRFGLPAALVVLLLVFGAVVAAMLPLALAIFSILVALGLTAALSQGFLLSTFILNMIVVMGLALGIDYALFILSRFREERAGGREKVAALSMAGGTAGRAVLFSGTAFVMAMGGLMLVPDTVLRSLAAGAILVAVVVVAAALTLLPAIISLLGERVNGLRIPFIGRRLIASGGHEGRFWGAIVRGVLRRPWLSFISATAVLLVFAAPLVTMNLGQIGMETLPDDLPSKQGYTLMEDSFEAVGVDPAEVVIHGDVGSESVGVAVEKLGAAVAADPGFGEQRIEEDASDQVALISIPLTGDPFGDRSGQAVERLREDHIPAAFDGVDAEALVTGATAFILDYVSVVWTWLPIVIGLVLLVTLILMTIAFRSIAIAASAILLNLLSVGAAYGLLVAVFQHGIGAGLFGFDEVEFIAPWIPLFMFAVLFGLSMDYQVFILSRIREYYTKTGDTSAAITHGIGTTARLITGAALIIVAVFAGFASGDLVMFQQMGFGVAVALLIDATIVRSVLVPALMGILGARNWYLPKSLEWLPHIEVEGSAGRREGP